MGNLVICQKLRHFLITQIIHYHQCLQKSLKAQIYIIFKKGSNALSKIELKTEIKANFDESFAHFKLTLGYTTNRCGVAKLEC